MDDLDERRYRAQADQVLTASATLSDRQKMLAEFFGEGPSWLDLHLFTQG